MSVNSRPRWCDAGPISFLELGARDDMNQRADFREPRRSIMGASNPHPHCQSGQRLLSRAPAKELRAEQGYFEVARKFRLCD